jgi:hypothetical protein
MPTEYLMSQWRTRGLNVKASVRSSNWYHKFNFRSHWLRNGTGAADMVTSSEGGRHQGERERRYWVAGMASQRSWPTS